MKKQIPALFLIFLLSACTPNFLSYIKTVPQKPLISFNDILQESGLICPTEISNGIQITERNYPDAVMSTNKHIELKKKSYTICVGSDSTFSIKADTKNYLTAVLYYSSSGIILDTNSSTPSQGLFAFLIGTQPGKIVIRLYNKDGILIKEETWYIEIGSFPVILKPE